MTRMRYASGGLPGPGHLVRFSGGDRVGLVRSVDWARGCVTVTFGTLALEASPRELVRCESELEARRRDGVPRHLRMD